MSIHPCEEFSPIGWNNTSPLKYTSTDEIDQFNEDLFFDESIIWKVVTVMSLMKIHWCDKIYELNESSPIWWKCVPVMKIDQLDKD